MADLSYNTVSNNSNLHVLSSKFGAVAEISRKDVLKVSKENVDSFVNTAEENATTKSLSNGEVPGLRKAMIVADPDSLDKQLSQLLPAFANLPQQRSNQISETILNGVKELSTKSKFDISSLAGGFTGRLAAILQVIVEAELKNTQSMAAQTNANNLMARAQGENSARNTVQAGRDGRNMVITQASAGMVATGVSTGMQMKASVQKNAAITVHAEKANTLKRHAATLDRQTVPTKLNNVGDALPSDPAILKATPKNLEFDAAAQNLQYQLRTQDADKLFQQGMAVNQIGQNGAALAAANGQVKKAEAESKASLAKADEGIYQAAKDSGDRRTQISREFKAMLMDIILQVSQNNANTVSVMANNLKG
ncbi:hypothetical protein AAGR22_20915 [Erwinia sp. HDF1-3R]|uniref:hypothetical protein n=1 Tax=Erwinia sp. HDF1-3R TaxID=3141543 RepID=UPI0031F47DB8